MLCRIYLREPKSTSKTNASPPVFQRLFGPGPLSLTSLSTAYRVPLPWRDQLSVGGGRGSHPHPFDAEAAAQLIEIVHSYFR
jgi:hypothetical protein